MQSEKDEIVESCKQRLRDTRAKYEAYLEEQVQSALGNVYTAVKETLTELDKEEYTPQEVVKVVKHSIRNVMEEEWVALCQIVDKTCDVLESD